MLSFIRNLPIRRKLGVAILGTTAASLVAACAAFIGYEVRTYRASMAEDMTLLADVLAVNSTAALQFQNQSDAEEVLRALKAEPDILAAGLYSGDGRLFASYGTSQYGRELPSQVGQEGTRFSNGRLVLFRPVLLNGARIGDIHLQAGLHGMYHRLRTYVAISALVLTASFLLAFVLASRLQRLIAGPILTLTETARLVSAKKDYSVRAMKQSDDELGLLTDSFNQMLTDIGQRTGDLEKASGSLRTQAVEITSSVGVLNSAVTEILEATNRLTTTATETAAAVSETSTTVEETRQTAQMSNQRAQFVSDSAQRAAEISQAGRKATDDAAAGMNRVQEQMGSLTQSIVRLGEQSQSIGAIVATVEDLAGQSQLLAVNAAIEAAKAGEHGRGFSVVAHEVRNLAEQSKRASGQVRTILRDIQRATSAAMMATDQSRKAVEDGVSQSGRAGESILNLAGKITDAAQAATQIAASGRQQVAGMDQVASAMTSIHKPTQQSVESAKRLESAARNLNDLGQKLKLMVERLGA